MGGYLQGSLFLPLAARQERQHEVNRVVASQRFSYPRELFEGYVDHRKEQTWRAFGDELVNKIGTTGAIIGPIHEDFRVSENFMEFDMQDYEHVIYAALTPLPEPQWYRFIGGPADGRSIKTGGTSVFLVPVLPPYHGYPFDIEKAPLTEYAEYELQGDTRVYMYKRMSS